MAILEMKVPSPGESITEVTISTWLVADGDVVEKDQELCEIESDKATLTLNAEEAGQIKILTKEGQAKVGDVVCTIDTDVKIQNSKIRDSKIENKVEEKKETANDKQQTANNKPETVNKKQETNYATGFPSPTAKKLMEEKNISVDKIKGSGKNGRITQADVVNADENVAENNSENEIEKPIEKSTPVQKTSVNKQETAVPQKINSTGKRNERREKMSPLRKKLAQRLVAVKQETAMLTTFNEVDMSEINHLRLKYKDAFKEKFGVSIGFMSFFTKAVCESLQKFPAVNSSIDGDEFIFHDYCDIGIAVSAPKGLVVPVVRNAETMGLADIEKEIKRLAILARDNKITINDMSGGTFTITNGGVFGSLMSTPILNPPQAAILGMHNVVERPIAVDGKVVIRPMMYVALSYDHRIIDGKESVSFLVNVKQLLENPLKLLFDGKDPEEVVMGL
jgi:2-oxoglutarate dehydrogenase E2 component (dihydrolipoamide succinyltransferase)